MTEAEYKSEWQHGLHQTDYNNCRFADNKIQFLQNWLFQRKLVNDEFVPCTNDIANIICHEKLHIATDANYCKLCQAWTDKILVYSELKKLNIQNIAIPVLYFAHEQLTQSILDNYANQSIIVKCNHGSGWNVVKKANTTSSQIVAKINEWLTLNYAYICGYEAQYEHIEPGFLIQPLLHTLPIDYGFWCNNGEVIAISLTKKLGKNLEEYVAFTDVNGKALNWCVGIKPELDDLSTSFKQHIQQMLPYVTAIAKLFNFVRIDMYYINDKVYFGETTFTPCGGKIALAYKQ